MAIRQYGAWRRRNRGRRGAGFSAACSRPARWREHVFPAWIEDVEQAAGDADPWGIDADDAIAEDGGGPLFFEGELEDLVLPAFKMECDVDMPALGRWISANSPEVVIVLDVFRDEGDPGSGFFLVRLAFEGDEHQGMELDPEEWQRFVMVNALSPA